MYFCILEVCFHYWLLQMLRILIQDPNDFKIATVVAPKKLPFQYLLRYVHAVYSPSPTAPVHARHKIKAKKQQ